MILIIDKLMASPLYPHKTGFIHAYDQSVTIPHHFVQMPKHISTSFDLIQVEMPQHTITTPTSHTKFIKLRIIYIPLIIHPKTLIIRISNLQL